MRIAFFSPLNPIRSGISDYSEELLPHLADHAEIDLFVDDYVPSNPEILARFPVHQASEFESVRQARRYDTCLYHLGNSAAHASAYDALKRFPGITVLHDYLLHHLVVSMTAAKGDEAAYVREMAYCHGRQGIDAARAALAANHQFRYEDFAANRRVVDASLGLIVHSDYTRSLLLATGSARPVEVIRFPAIIESDTSDHRLTRAHFGYTPENVVFGSFGLVTPTKRFDLALRAFRRVRDRLPTARFLVVGDIARDADLKPLIDELGLADTVHCAGYVTKEDMLRDIAAVDVGINLRWPIGGETSASLLRLLAAGKPTIVTDAGPFAEFPASCCPKVAVGLGEETRLAETMLRLALNPALRAEMSLAARQHVVDNHSIAESARHYLRFIDRILDTGR